ncbi:perlucin-like [Haliotis rubra]|uniref:perlucin-like n=1 Tax=Haliotis rubra TaxID=36100 RepID=UPI001EE5E430|nr:perlucin-like [Haliotis rubra]
MFYSSISITVLLAVVNVVSSDCPNGYLRHDDSCYSLIRVQASWAEAAVYCQAIGSHLAYVKTASEQTFLEGYLKREDSTITTDGVWIGGLTYLIQNEWQWGFQNTRIESTWWSPGQPDDYHNIQLCLMLYKGESYRWDDKECNFKEFFLCELELKSTPGIVGK